MGFTIWLVADKEDTDRYGRFLRYVWTNGGSFFNELAVRQGHARAVLYEPNDAYIDLMRAAEAEAKAANRGMWGPAADRGNSPGSIVEFPQVAELRVGGLARLAEIAPVVVYGWVGTAGEGGFDFGGEVTAVEGVGEGAEAACERPAVGVGGLQPSEGGEVGGDVAGRSGQRGFELTIIGAGHGATAWRSASARARWARIL